MTSAMGTLLVCQAVGAVRLFFDPINGVLLQARMRPVKFTQK
jgi:hypothetical protein